MSRTIKKKLVKRYADKILHPMDADDAVHEHVSKPYTKDIKGSYISPAKRAANKESDGIPVRKLTKDERRYWARANRYARKTGTEPDFSELLA